MTIIYGAAALGILLLVVGFAYDRVSPNRVIVCIIVWSTLLALTEIVLRK